MNGEESPIDRDESEEDSDTILVQYDWSSTSPSIAVAETIAAITDRQQNELEPLYERVDPDSLDVIVNPQLLTRFDAGSIVSFPYDDYLVTVRSSGEVRVELDGFEPSE